MITDPLAVAAASWGVLMALAPTLQIRRILERRSSADVSLAYLGVLLVGFVLWIAYGIALGNAALIVPNSVALAVGTLTVLVAIRFRRPGDGDSIPRSGD
jgi:MtN3 and saliva related transmembrane protein